MDSDSSLDGEFESKHEVAARRNSAATQSESDSEENDESDLSSTDSEDEQDGSAVPSHRRSSPLSHVGDGYDSDGGKQLQSPTSHTPQSHILDRENWMQSLDVGGLPGTVVGIRSPGSDQGKLSLGSNSCRHSSSEDGKQSPSSQNSKHNPASVHGKHSSSSEDEEDTLSSEDGKCSPNFEDGKCSPTSEHGKNSPTSEDGKCFPTSEDGKRFPTSEDGKHFPTSEDGKRSPTSEDGKRSPTSENGKHSPSSEGEKRSPSSEGEKRSPSSEGEKRSPSSESGKHSPMSEKGKLSPSSEGGKRSPTSEGGKSSPISEGGKRSPTSEGGKRSPTSEGGKRSPTAEGGKRSPTSEGGKRSPSSEGEMRSPSSEGEMRSPSSEGGMRSPSSGADMGSTGLVVGKRSTGSGVGKRSTCLDVGNRSSGSGVGKRSSGSGVGKRSSGSGVGKRSSGSGVGKRSSGSGVGKHSSGSGVGKHSSGSGVTKHFSVSGVGKRSSGSGVGKRSSGSGVGKRSSSSGVGNHSPGSGVVTRSSGSGVGTRSSSSGVRKHSPTLGTGKTSPSPHIGTDFIVVEHPPSLSPRSPSFRDELCVRSPDPGKCTPSSDHENQSSFYGKVHSSGDRSPSTDFGKQSPGSCRGKWTPSPDRGMLSPKLRGSELGDESVGSCSGIRSPSLNGDTRSSRAWSPSPERDKHFRVASQEVQSSFVDAPAVNSPMHKNDVNSEEIVSRSESVVLVTNRDSENHSPKLFSKESSPKSNLCELSVFLAHNKDSVKSPRSHSLDVWQRKASPKTNKKTLVTGHVSPTSNDDGELSDSSQDVSLKFKKLSTRASDGETVMENVQTNGEIDKTVKKSNITSHGEDLSDVSDLEINDGAESLGEVLEDHVKKMLKGTLPAEEVEQLDFEAEEREEGECEAREDGKSEDEGELKGDELEEGELTDDDEYRPEETEPRPICRFYSRGQCTWGPNCRFLHPGVTDKGNYTMFDMVRPLVTINGPPIYPVEYRVPVPVPFEKPAPAAPYQGPRKEEPPVFESAWERGLRQAKEMMRKSTKRKEMDMDFEEKKMNLSLGQEELDKENDYYTRQASPTINIKEENDRWSSYDRLKGPEPDGKYVREGSVFEEYPSDHPYYHQHSRGEYWRRVQYEPGGSDPRSSSRLDSSDYRSSSKYRRSPSDNYYDKYDKKKKTSSHSTREVIMQRVDKPWRDERYVEVSTVSSHRGRGDEWADPWMRSKSPTGRKGTSSRPTRKSYSSGSSYSSSSSSRSSSHSSYSSYSRDSHSRSRSKSFSRSRSRSRSRSPAARRRKPNRPLVPTARAAMAAGEVSSQSFRVGKLVPELRTLTKAKPTVATLLTASEKKAVTERALLMNPPAPTPRKNKDARPPSPGMMRKVAQNPPAPSANASKGVSGQKTTLDRPKLTVAGAASIKAKMRSHSASSRSSSGSDSSGSSSDSSESSYSSSSSSREPSPKVVRPQKRMVIDERERLAFAQSMKIKAMDALKLSGQKQQIKLTLKTPGSLGGSAVGGVTTVKKPGTGLPELPELNLVRRERGVATLAGKKRPAEDVAVADQGVAAKMAALSKPAVKKATSRREELLKQLKAVEDAIARKRSKIIP